MNHTTWRSFITLGLLSTFLTACGFSAATSLGNEDTSDSSSSSDSNSSASTNDFVASWEKTTPSRRAWSDFVRQVIETKAPELYAGPTDVADFCPMYDRLGKIDRLNFWVELTAAIAKFESGWKPTSRMTETTMGTDPITKKQVVSEGLLQLSYQDIQWAKFCEFNWLQDNKSYPSLTDSRRSILDPYKNLSCGLQILNRQVKNKGAIALSAGVYWSVLKINGKYSKLPQIKAMTNALSFCK